MTRGLPASYHEAQYMRLRQQGEEVRHRISLIERQLSREDSELTAAERVKLQKALVNAEEALQAIQEKVQTVYQKKS